MVPLNVFCMPRRAILTLAGIVGIIWPLSVVGQESSNSPITRRWAVKQLQSINTSMGFRQAGLLAETISRDLDGPIAPSWRICISVIQPRRSTHAGWESWRKVQF